MRHPQVAKKVDNRARCGSLGGAESRSIHKGKVMARIHVCSLSKVPETVRATGAQSLVSLINHGTIVQRPREISPSRHLYVAVSDITEAMDGHILPEETHVHQILGFLHGWDRGHPLLIHCWAGVSRSTAAAYIAACALSPDRSEGEIARAIRRNSPTATPNARLVALADAVLDRGGRMVAAIAGIGRGRECEEGSPFAVELL
jgi:predicted protein tyrosine phosphatase